MDLEIKGKKALVTGGATGIGRAIALELSKEGVSVVITSRNEDKLNKTLEMIGGRENGHYGVIINIAEESAPQMLAAEIDNNIGELDIIVNNVGSTFDITDSYCSISDWRKVFRLNLEVAIEINNIFLPYMKEQNWGRIVNISSIAGLENNGPVTYCVSKAALTAYTRIMGRILATETSNVIMTAVMPGVVYTEGGYWEKTMKERPEHAERYLKERCPLRRFGKPSEISSKVVFLCSEKATFCQGAIVPVDAGQAKHYMSFTFLP